MRFLFVFKTITYFHYHHTLIDELCRRGHHIDIVVDPDSGGEPVLLDEIGFTPPAHWSVTSTVAVARGGRFQGTLGVLRSLRSYTNYFRRTEQSRHYVRRWRGWLPRWLQLVLRVPAMGWLLSSAPVRAAIAGFDRAVAPSAGIVADIAARKPDLVFATPANRPGWTDAEYIKAANALGIPTVLLTLSWDNLTTKGVFPVQPRVMLVWNEEQRREAIVYQSMPRERTLAVGSIFFDRWLEGEVEPTEREAFLRELSLAEDARFAVYLGSARNIAPDESWLVRQIARAMHAHPDPVVSTMSLVVRPHPGNSRPYEDMDEPGVVVWPPRGVLPTDDDTKRSFVSTLQHATCAIGINTSAMIDAIVNGTPCTAIVADEYKSTQEQTVHFQQLLRAGVLERAPSPEACAEVLGTLLRGEDATREARGVFVHAFVRPRGMDRAARAVVADAFELAARGNGPADIDRALDGAAAGASA